VAAPVHTCSDVGEVVRGAEGLVNATPVGMVGTPGSPVPPELLGGRRWAFDAVYTPRDTEFLQHARRAGLGVLDGYELFFHQGVAAFELFTGRRPGDPGELRRRLDPLQAQETR
jgi:shikimate dehydrogenase